MSLTAEWFAKEWAAGRTPDEIRAEIAACEARAEWQGVEFDDLRVRHQRRTHINTLRTLL